MIKTITSRTFQPYGWVIAFPRRGTRRSTCRKGKNLFRIVKIRKNPCGWRIAYLVVRERSIRRLEQHPGILESFEPVKGRCILYVAARREHRCIQAFYLNKPVILKKGLWHGVVTVSPEAEIKITEDAAVRTVHWRLGVELNHSPARRWPIKS